MGRILLVIWSLALYGMFTMATVHAQDLTDFAIVDSKGDVKFTKQAVIKMLQEGKTCVMYRSSARFKSKGLTKKKCRDKDYRERYGIRVIKCKHIADNALSSACKGIK
jgi:hypothetical protein